MGLLKDNEIHLSIQNDCTMKEEALIITIDFRNDHFSAIYLNNQLKLISSSGSMITINDPTHVRALKVRTDISENLFAFFKH